MIVAFRGGDKFVIIGDREQSMGFAPMMRDEYCPTSLTQVAELARKFRRSYKNTLHYVPRTADALYSRHRIPR